MDFTEELADLFVRDLKQLISNMEEIDEKHLWKVPPGVTNSCGVLAQHLAGNLNHFIGASLGDTGYVRDRRREFTDTGRPKPELIADIQQLIDTVSRIIRNLDEDKLNEPYPGKIPYEGCSRKILLHLYGHLSYHMGQVNYLRRILAGNQELID